MQFKTYMVAFTLTGAAAFPMNAQTSASAENNTIERFSNELPSIDGDNWTFYLDTESKVYYIDFETISVNLSDLKVVNESGEVVKKDNLWNLPVNTIYELDFTDLKPGKYKVELRSYTGIITKEVVISE